MFSKDERDLRSGNVSRTRQIFVQTKTDVNNSITKNRLQRKSSFIWKEWLALRAWHTVYYILTLACTVMRGRVRALVVLRLCGLLCRTFVYSTPLRSLHLMMGFLWKTTISQFVLGLNNCLKILKHIFKIQVLIRGVNT